MRIMIRCSVCDLTEYPEPCFPNGNPVIDVEDDDAAWRLLDGMGDTLTWEVVPDDTPLRALEVIVRA